MTDYRGFAPLFDEFDKLLSYKKFDVYKNSHPCADPGCLLNLVGYAEHLCGWLSNAGSLLPYSSLQSDQNTCTSKSPLDGSGSP
jgi:hypothetical protein